MSYRKSRAPAANEGTKKKGSKIKALTIAAISRDIYKKMICGESPV